MNQISEVPARSSPTVTVPALQTHLQNPLARKPGSAVSSRCCVDPLKPPPKADPCSASKNPAEAGFQVVSVGLFAWHPAQQAQCRSDKPHGSRCRSDGVSLGPTYLFLDSNVHPPQYSRTESPDILALALGRDKYLLRTQSDGGERSLLLE